MVVEGDTLLHLLVRNDAHKDTVEACLRGGADVGAVNARGEQVLGLARKAAARSGQRRHHGPGASEEARERRLHAEGVVVVIEKYNARRNTSGRKRARRRARLGPGGARSPRSPSSSRGRRRRSASPIRPRTAPEVNASREVDAWRRVAARAHTAADAIEARFRDAWTHEDAEKAARTAQNDDVVVAAVRGAVAEALTARADKFICCRVQFLLHHLLHLLEILLHHLDVHLQGRHLLLHGIELIAPRCCIGFAFVLPVSPASPRPPAAVVVPDVGSPRVPSLACLGALSSPPAIAAAARSAPSGHDAILKSTGPHRRPLTNRRIRTCAPLRSPIGVAMAAQIQ